MPARSQASIDLTRVAELVTTELDAAPCAVVAAAVRRNDAWIEGFGASGRLSREPRAEAATIDTPFDLASVTKPMTALAMARLERRRELSRDEPLDAFLPALAKTPSARLPLDLFAAHRAGLEAHQPLYLPFVEGRPVTLEEAAWLAANARREGLVGAPPPEGFAPVYSDMGYLLVGAAIEARAGVPLDELVRREVLTPLEMKVGSARQRRALDATFDERVAPTEDVAWRGGTVRGAVHDENAWAIGGDASCGHAGLFGDARSVLALGKAVLEALEGLSSDWLDARSLEPLLRDRPGGSLLAGFDRKSGDSPSSGARFGPRTFGHLGFTGTSLWIDPEALLVGVLLTNRVQPTREHIAIRRARPAVYDALFAAMTEG